MWCAGSPDVWKHGHEHSPSVLRAGGSVLLGFVWDERSESDRCVHQAVGCLSGGVQKQSGVCVGALLKQSVFDWC